MAWPDSRRRAEQRARRQRGASNRPGNVLNSGGSGEDDVEVGLFRGPGVSVEPEGISRLAASSSGSALSVEGKIENEVIWGFWILGCPFSEAETPTIHQVSPHCSPPTHTHTPAHKHSCRPLILPSVLSCCLLKVEPDSLGSTQLHLFLVV